MLGMKQSGLAEILGKGWDQSSISLLESKDIIDPKIREEVAKALKIPAEAITNFDEDAAVSIISNTFRDNSILNGINYNPTFHPLDKLIQVLEKQIKELKAENKALRLQKGRKK